MVSVAQLVESRIVIPVVVGSSPIVHPIKSIAYIAAICTKIKSVAIGVAIYFSLVGFTLAVETS
jgi:hypothetical protein